MARSASDAILTSAVFSIQQGTESERQQAAEHIVATHWKTLYKYIRFRHQLPPDDAQASLQGFLSHILRKENVGRFDPKTSPLRHFLRRELDRHITHSAGAESAQAAFPLDFTAAEEEYLAETRAPGLAADTYFENEWVRAMFTLALEELYSNLAAEGKEIQFTLFLRSDLQDRSATNRALIDEIAAELGMPVDEAMNALASTRQQLHRILIDIVRPLTMSETEFRREMRTISGISAS